MKTCSRCGGPSHSTKRKSLICLACRRIYDKEWRARRKASGNPVISVKMSREYFAAYNQTYYARTDVKQRNAERQREYVTRPYVAPKVSARLATRNAIRRGELTRLPCEVCGDPKTHAHHHDYSKPLDVKWLCRTHHEAIHYAKAEAK